jgi:hypothetical protein
MAGRPRSFDECLHGACWMHPTGTAAVVKDEIVPITLEDRR